MANPACVSGTLRSGKLRDPTRHNLSGQKDVILHFFLTDWFQAGLGTYVVVDLGRALWLEKIHWL